MDDDQPAMIIKKVDVFSIQVAPKFQRAMSKGPIKYGRTLVKIHSDDDVVGVGEVRTYQPFLPETGQSTASAIRDYYAPALIGEDPFDLEKIFTKFETRILPGNTHAKAAIDYALHDLIGKYLKVPVYKLLGGKYWDKVPFEWSLGLNPVEKMIQEAQTAAQKFGIKVISMKVGPSERWRKDIEDFVAINEALSDGVSMAFDANAMYTRRVAVKVIKSLEKYDLLYAEQPVPGWDIRGMAEIRRAVDTPIMADESVFTCQDAMRVIREDAADIICVKPGKPGGLHNCKKIAAIAEAANVEVNVGGTAIGSQLEASVAINLFASTPNIRTPAEAAFGLGTVEEDVIATKRHFDLRNGEVDVPNRPGLGIEIDEDALQRAAAVKYTIPHK